MDPLVGRSLSSALQVGCVVNGHHTFVKVVIIVPFSYIYDKVALFSYQLAILDEISQ